MKDLKKVGIVKLKMILRLAWLDICRAAAYLNTCLTICSNTNGQTDLCVRDAVIINTGLVHENYTSGSTASSRIH